MALVLLAGAIVVPALTPTSVGPTQTPSGVTGRPYVEGVLGWATNASPFGARTAADRMLVALLFRGLVRLGPGDGLVPDLAARWEVDPSGAVWTFHLRPDATWHDGLPITAADVAFTIGALGDPGYAGPGGASWREVTTTIVDPLTIRLELAAPIGGFLQAMTQAIAPAHLLSSVAPGELAEHAFGRQPVGSGPFRLESFDAERAILPAWAPSALPASTDPGEVPVGGVGAVADEGGGQPTPYLPAIELRFFADPTALATAWRAGDLDAVSGLAPVDLAALADDASGATVARYPGSTLLAVVPNLRPARPRLREAAVRLALLQAIDRDRIVRDVLAGFGSRADAAIPPTSWAFDPVASPAQAADPDAAIAGLTSVGWVRSDGGWTPKGADAPFTIEVLGPERDVNPVAYETAEAVASAWRAIGFGVTHLALDATVLADRLRAGDFDVAVIGVNVGLDPDLYPLLASSQTTGARTNVLGLQDPVLDGLLAAARAPGTTEARRVAYSALQVRLTASTYLLPIAVRDEIALVTDGLSGASIRPIGDAGGRFWDVLTWRLASR